MERSKAVAFPSRGCVGSIQWGIDTGRAYDIKGIWRYGRELYDCDSHEHAANLHLAYDCAWDPETFTFLAPAFLSVSRVGPFSFMRVDARTFAILRGKPVEVARDHSSLT